MCPPLICLVWECCVHHWLKSFQHGGLCTVLLLDSMNPRGGWGRLQNEWDGLKRHRHHLWVTLWECDETALWLLLWAAHNRAYMHGHGHGQTGWDIHSNFFERETFGCTSCDTCLSKRFKIKVLSQTKLRTHVLNNRSGGTVWGSHLSVKYQRPVYTLSQLALTHGPGCICIEQVDPGWQAHAQDPDIYVTQTHPETTNQSQDTCTFHEAAPLLRCKQESLYCTFLTHTLHPF